MNLQSKILLFLCPLIVVPLLFLGWIAYDRLYTGTRQAVLGQMQTTLKQVELHVQSKFRTAEANIELFTHSHLLANYILTPGEGERYTLMQPSLLRLFASYQRAYPEYYEIRVLLPDGYEDARSVSISIPNVQEEEHGTPYFQEMSARGDPIYSTFFRNPDNGKISCLIAGALRLRDNEMAPVGSEPVLRGYLAVTMDLYFMEQLVKTSRIGDKGRICFTDDEGTILFHPDAARINARIPRSIFQRFLTEDASEPFPLVKDTARGILFAGNRLHPRLFLVAMFPEAELSASARSLGFIVAGIILATILFTVGLLLVTLNRLIVNPIRRLKSAFQTVGRGDLGVRVPAPAQDELGVLATEFNITTEKLSLLTVSRDYVESILRSMNDALIVVTPDGVIETVNASACALLGKEEKGIIGEPLSRFFDESDYSLVGDFKGKDHITNVEKKILKKDGTSVSILFSGSVMRDGHSEIQRITCVLRDITTLKRAEQEKSDLENKLHRYEKMEALGMLAGGVAHDLNNILSGIVSYPELLLLDLPEDSPLRKPILTIKKSGEKAAAIVQDLLTLARRGVAVTEVVNMNKIVAEYLSSPEYQRLRIHHEEVRVETRLESGLFNIQGSPVHIAKAVMNLMSNAAEAMMHGGKIVISTGNRYVDRPVSGYDEVNEGEYAVLSVSDTGVGIPAGDVERIFEPFYTKKVMGRSGSGLGMAVVWGTVKDHQGYIDVESTEGKGTRFSLFFPAVREVPVEGPEACLLDDLTGNGESILIVDDVAEQREIAASMLRRLGYKVAAVASGEDAVDYLAVNSVDLLLLDMIMDPGMDGLDTYRKIIELNPRQRAVIASGFSETDRVKEALALGVGQYLRKPYDLKTIGLAVRSELDGFRRSQ